jgi:MYXO-CTERM domain-containing protein
LQSPTIVAVFWNSAVNATLKANIGQFYADVTQSAFWSVLQEYDTVGLAGGTEQAILPGTFGGAVTLAPSKCTATSAATCAITDAQLQTELSVQIANGVLPAPSLDCTGHVNTIYMMHFPPNVVLTGPAGVGTSCANTNGFCAYHNTGTYGAHQTPLVYAALMDTFTGGCSSGCGTNPTALENATETASHELVEAATDPEIGLDTLAPYAFPAAWGDNNNNCGEIGDICDDGRAGDAITVGGRTWIVQEFWSNAQGHCTSSGAVLPVCSATTATSGAACRACSCGDNGGACAGALPICEAASGQCVASDAGAGARDAGGDAAGATDASSADAQGVDAQGDVQGAADASDASGEDAADVADAESLDAENAKDAPTGIDASRKDADVGDSSAMANAAEGGAMGGGDASPTDSGAGSAPEAGFARDAAEGHAAEGDAAEGHAGENSNGCACRIVRTGSAPSSHGLFALAAVASLGLRRRRSRARDSVRCI